MDHVDIHTTRSARRRHAGRVGDGAQRDAGRGNRLLDGCGKVNMGVVHGPRRTRLTQLRAPAHSEEAGDRDAELTGAVDGARAQQRGRCRLLGLGSRSEAHIGHVVTYVVLGCLLLRSDS
jgi:hypothetical protein